MGATIKMESGFDDLVFENRNREYGAYVLRKRYNSIVILSLIAASALVSAAVVIPFLHTLKGEQKLIASSENIRYVKVHLEKLQPPENEIIIPPAPSPPPPVVQAPIKYVAPVIVDTLLPAEKTISTNAEIQASPENILSITNNGGDQDVSLPGQGDENNNEPYIIVEVTPAFMGGDIDKFREWVLRRTNYPQEALDKRIHGKVSLTFIIEKDGSVSNVKVIKGVDPLIDSEAVKAIEASPKWSPGLQRGRPVRVRYAIVLNFLPLK